MLAVSHMVTDGPLPEALKVAIGPDANEAPAAGSRARARAPVRIGEMGETRVLDLDPALRIGESWAEAQARARSSVLKNASLTRITL